MLFPTLLLLGAPGADAAAPIPLIAAGLRAAAGQVRQNELFATWEKAQRETRTLVVEFTAESEDPTFHTTERFRGSLKLRGTAAGQIQARYELTPAEKGKQGFLALLLDDKVYWIQPDKKVALRFDLPKKDAPLWLKEHSFPFALLLDRARARQQWRLQMSKTDAWYTYLDLEQRRVKRGGWMTDCFVRGQVVLMNKDGAGVPRNFPRRLRTDEGIRSCTYDIARWSINGRDKLADEDFVNPEAMRGWEVLKEPPPFWPLKSK